MKIALKALSALLITLALTAPTEAWPKGHGGYHSHGRHR
jgi:hypothetical protein